jgi:hypothetical protein
VNLRVGAVECSLGQIASGDVAGNVNRWRAQMGLPPLTAAEVDALPRAELLDKPAVVVDLEGAYSGMGAAPQPDFRMLARFAQFPGFALTVKMTGPAAAVAAEAERFAAFCDSLGFNPAALDSGAADRTTNTPSGAASPAPALPAEPEPELAATPAFDPGRLAWDTPDGWTAAGPSGMRLATFTPEDAARTECYVTVLDGTAGGILQNVNRWRAEMQLDPLAEADLAALPTLQVLGAASPLLEIEGTFRGMRGETVEDALMLALICPLADYTVFVKLVGPADEARGAREGFVALCESLR